MQNDEHRYSIDVIKECSPKELNDLEIFYINKLKPKFNFTKGGDFNYCKRQHGKYTMWDTSKMHYISHKNQNRNKPFRLCYYGYYVPCGYFEDPWTAQLVWSLIDDENKGDD